MIVVSGTFVFPAGTRDAVIAAMTEVATATVKEEGCITYRFYSDIASEDTYRVFEEWASNEALDAHLQTPHLGAFRAALQGLKPKSAEVKRYEIESVGPLVRD